MIITTSLAFTGSSFAQSGNALIFDGNDDYVACGNDGSVQIGGTAITIEAWINPASFGGGYWTNTIVDKTYNSVGNINSGYAFRCGGSGQLDFGFGYWDGSAGGWPSGTSDAFALSAGVWQHVAATYDGSAIRLYVNGTLVKTIAESRIISINTVTPLAIGNPDPASVGGLRGFNGKIDEVRIWNTVRTAQQIADNKNVNLVGNEAGLAAYYKMNEGSGTTTADQQTLSKNTGTLVNHTSWGVSGALPVELLSFTAQIAEKNVELKWNTATETNNYGFEVERATKNGTLSSGAETRDDKWTKIGFVEGSGTTNAPKSYSFTDKSANGKTSYRLKQIDRDGKFEYSQSVEVTASSTPNEFGLEQNYPNPFNPTTMINYQIPVTNHVSLKVFDMLGKEVATLVNETKETGSYSAKFDGAKLSSGIYFYKLQSGNSIAVKKLTIMK